MGKSWSVASFIHPVYVISEAWFAKNRVLTFYYLAGLKPKGLNSLIFRMRQVIYLFIYWVYMPLQTSLSLSTKLKLLQRGKMPKLIEKIRVARFWDILDYSPMFCFVLFCFKWAVSYFGHFETIKRWVLSCRIFITHFRK